MITQASVRTAINGWPGVFIPGDNALSTANELNAIAEAVERGDEAALAALPGYLRRMAAKLQECKI